MVTELWLYGQNNTSIIYLNCVCLNMKISSRKAAHYYIFFNYKDFSHFNTITAPACWDNMSCVNSNRQSPTLLAHVQQTKPHINHFKLRIIVNIVLSKSVCFLARQVLKFQICRVSSQWVPSISVRHYPSQ